ncbi:EamA family transporter [Alkalinema sp. FACHB-956]|uniref:EamA family transporter n=1 Tax=Alkalinema sp. FACHB-956 TaxID=2692768 RepID=UPI00168982D5|nr:EamA family transporter [Alkalinema sp. FACHB-956]MBD2326047.1 EamA family transporter [Alkalinema sp. FACHB-956]
MSFAAFCLLMASVAASVGGQFFLKQGALALGTIDSSNVLAAIVSMITKWQILVGLVCYGLGVVTYILLLNKVNLSIASPLLALSYVFAVLLGLFFFKEKVTLVQYIGIAFIFLGVVLLTRSTSS